MATYPSPATVKLPFGQHVVSVPLIWKDMTSQKSYMFKQWQDGTTSPTKNVNLQNNLKLTGTYEEVNFVANIMFSGMVTAQVASGEAVKITVTKPDGSTETLTATTIPDKTYSTTKQYTVAGQYSAKSHQDADSQYSAWDSPVMPFTIELESRSGTLVVTLT